MPPLSGQTYTFITLSINFRNNLVYDELPDNIQYELVNDKIKKISKNCYKRYL